MHPRVGDFAAILPGGRDALHAYTGACRSPSPGREARTRRDKAVLVASTPLEDHKEPGDQEHRQYQHDLKHRIPGCQAVQSPPPTHRRLLVTGQFRPHAATLAAPMVVLWKTASFQEKKLKRSDPIPCSWVERK